MLDVKLTILREVSEFRSNYFNLSAAQHSEQSNKADGNAVLELTGSNQHRTIQDPKKFLEASI